MAFKAYSTKDIASLLGFAVIRSVFLRAERADPEAIPATLWPWWRQ